MAKDWTGSVNSVYTCLGASNHCSDDRQENDYYATDSVAIDKLLNGGGKPYYKIYEPACGEGHLAKRLEELGYEVVASDLIDRGYGKGGVDFLNLDKKNLDRDILTNPPYKFASEFVEKGLDVVADGRSVWMFLKLQFLEGKKRRELFDKGCLKHVYVSSERILCAKNGDFEAMKASGGSAVAYMWAQFQKGYKGETTLSWI